MANHSPEREHTWKQEEAKAKYKYIKIHTKTYKYIHVHTGIQVGEREREKAHLETGRGASKMAICTSSDDQIEKVAKPIAHNSKIILRN